MQVKDREPGHGDVGVPNTSTQEAEAEDCGFDDSMGCLKIN